MSQHRALISCPLIQDTIHEFDETLASHGIAYDVPDVDQQLSEAELLACIDEYDAILAGDDELTGRVLRAADRLQVVAKWGVGTDNIDQETAADEGIAVYNTPGTLSDEVADVVLGYSTMLTHRLHEVDDAVRAGEWYCPRGTSLRGATLGIVGVGNIGSAVARRAAAHRMTVLGYDVVPLDDELVAETGISRVDRDELFERADVVSINCPLNSETEKMVDRAALQRLGPDGYLVNTSRGEIVDQSALVAAVRDGTIAGAALDVFEREPLPSDDPLTELDDVLLGSHNAQNTHEAVQRTNERCVENLVNGLAETTTPASTD